MGVDWGGLGFTKGLGCAVRLAGTCASFVFGRSGATGVPFSALATGVGDGVAVVVLALVLRSISVMVLEARRRRRRASVASLSEILPVTKDW